MKQILHLDFFLAYSEFRTQYMGVRLLLWRIETSFVSSVALRISALWDVMYSSWRLILLFLSLQSAKDCVECQNNQDGELCVDRCPSGGLKDRQAVWKYSNATGHCLPCNTNCTIPWVKAVRLSQTVKLTYTVYFYSSCVELDERGCPVDNTTGWARSAVQWCLLESVCSGFLQFYSFIQRHGIHPTLFLFRPGTTIAAAVGGVVLVFILLALLVFYLRRQKKMRRKETVRRYLQEQEVSAENEFTPQSRVYSEGHPTTSFLCVSSWWSL